MSKQKLRYGYKFIECPMCESQTFNYISYSEYGIGTVEGYKNAIECYTKEYTIRKSNIQYDKAIDDAKSVILQTIDNETLVDTLHLRLEQLKEKNNE